MKQEKIYQLSQPDYDIVSRAVRFCPDAVRALKRATVLKKNPQQKSDKHGNKELLTDAKMHELFGANYKHILYYNFDEKRWNTDRYFYGLTDLEFATDITKQAKPVFARAKAFRGMELVAVIVMAVEDKVYLGFGDVARNPKPFVKNPGASVGTIVCRDKSTGKIVYEPNAWLGISRWADAATAKIDSVMSRSARCMGVFCARNIDFRKTLMKLYAKQK
ncbi:MAG: hypothetical protein IKW57_00015 [Alphaproteobacteria bacterium]|nr:hypothetical protein [Alphaproteobacteria bacterium]